MEAEAPRTIEELWRARESVAPYPDGVIPVPELIRGTAFFPGGRGFWLPTADSRPVVESGGIMVLGHDFHSEVGYRESLARGAEASTQPTWRQLVRILRDSAIPLEMCFFTNFYMGLRKGHQTTGTFPGAKDPGFVTRCREFFKVQLAVYRPQLILTLGRFVPPQLAPLSAALTPWAGAPSLKRIDRVGPVFSQVTLDTSSRPLQTSVVTLTHPSLRHLSVHHRRYAGFEGETAERAMLARGCEAFRVYSSHRCEI